MNNSLMTSPPSPTSNSLRNLLHMNASLGGYGSANGQFMPSLSPTSKNYTSSMLNNKAMQMYLNSLQGGSMSGTSKSSTAPSSYENSPHSYLQQFGLLRTMSNTAPTSTSIGNTSSSSNIDTVNSVAQRNPMLSKELSTPSVTPTRPPVALSLPGNQTSVITKTTLGSTINPNAPTTSTMARQSPTYSSVSSMPSKAPAVVSIPTIPSDARGNSNEVLPKNVNAINQLTTQTKQPPSSSKNKPNDNKIISNQIRNSANQSINSTASMSIMKSSTSFPVPVALTKANVSTSILSKDNFQPAKDTSKSPAVTTNFGIFYPPTSKSNTTNNSTKKSDLNANKKSGSTSATSFSESSKKTQLIVNKGIIY